VKLDPDIRLRARERVAIAQFDLRSRAMPHKNRSLRVGAVGRMTYSIEDADPYLRAALNILADFALFSGVGAQTATGMGQARRVG
jgi:CRISPR-associated endoribonuclease Cas6